MRASRDSGRRSEVQGRQGASSRTRSGIDGGRRLGPSHGSESRDVGRASRAGRRHRAPSAPARRFAERLASAWQEWRDSNPRPSVLETDALTGLSYTPKRRNARLAAAAGPRKMLVRRPLERSRARMSAAPRPTGGAGGCGRRGEESADQRVSSASTEPARRPAPGRRARRASPRAPQSAPAAA
jgi:hypothetical protein